MLKTLGIMIEYLSYLRLNFNLWKYRKRGIKIGENVYISPKAYIDSHKGSSVRIGNNVYITRNVVILNHTDTHKGGPLNLWTIYGGERICKDVIIENNVFIGVNSVIMPGVRIGKNSIIGALSFVTTDIPEGAVFAGVPAKQITTTGDMIKKDLSKFRLEDWKKECF